MKMSVGLEVRRAIDLKYRQRLKAALATHEIVAVNDYRDNAHMLMLMELCETVEKANERYHVQI